MPTRQWFYYDSPEQVSGLKCWWKADSLGLSDGDPISTWVDSSIETNDFTAAGAARPTYKTNIKNGLPVVRFTFASSHLMSTGATNTVPTGTAAMTWFFVASRVVSASTWRMVGHNSGNGWSSGTGGVNTTFRHTFTGVQNYDFAKGWDLGGAFYVWSLLLAADKSVILRRNGSSFGTVAGSAFANAPGTVAFQVGGAGGSAGFDGDVAEMFMYNVALSTGDRGSMEQYLARKWGMRFV